MSVLSVVMPVWNTHEDQAQMTERNVRRLWEVQTVPTELIAIDNGSVHPGKYVANVVVRWNANRGIAPAWNMGARSACGEVLCFLNNDVTVEPGWDRALCTAALKHPAIVFPHTHQEPDDGIGIAGWCFALSRDVWKRVGQFDEAFVPAFYEDTDYFQRALGHGFRLLSVPAASVTHTRRTSARYLPRMDLLFQAHRLKFSWKHNLDPNVPPPFWTVPLVRVEE